MEESLLKNEIKNIKRTTFRGYDSGPFLWEDDLNDWEEVLEEEINLDEKYWEIE